MNGINRRSLLGGALAAPALLRAARAAEVVKLDFPSWQAEEPGLSQWWKQLIADFEAAHRGVTVDFVQIPFPQYVSTLTTRFAGGSPPDIVHLPSRNFAAFASQGWLAPLDDVLKGTAAETDWSPLQAEMRWEGATRGLLLMGYGMMLFYNEALLQQAGLALPTTPNEWLSAIAKLTDRAQGRFGIADATVEHPNVAVSAACWVYGEGQDWLKGGTWHFTDPNVVGCMDQYRAAMRDAPPGMTSEAARPIFLQGKAAFWRDGPWFSAALKGAPPEIRPHLRPARLPFPVVPGGTSNSLHMPDGLSGRKKELVADFIRLVTAKPQQRSYALLSGSPAPRRDALTEADMQAHPEIALANRLAARAVNIFPTADAVRENYNVFARDVAQGCMRLLSSDAPTPQVMADLQRRLAADIPLKA